MSENNIYRSPEAPLEEADNSSLAAVAIGPNNTEYYLGQMERHPEEDNFVSWNWAAFLVTTFWLLYRKLWFGFALYVLILPFAFNLVSVMFATVIGEQASLWLQVVFSILLALIFPIYCNGLYARKVRKLVATAESVSSDEEEQKAWLRARGGTSMIWIFVVAAFFLLGIIAALVLPAYSEYMQELMQPPTLPE